MSGFRGTNQYHDHKGERIGAISQWRLLPIMRACIDIAAREGHGSATRDQARATLRMIRTDCNWQTAFVLRNIGIKRCRYLRGLGWPVPDRFLTQPEEETLRMRRNFGMDER